MLVLPAPADLRDWHSVPVEDRRAEALDRACRYASAAEKSLTRFGLEGSANMAEAQGVTAMATLAAAWALIAAATEET